MHQLFQDLPILLFDVPHLSGRLFDILVGSLFCGLIIYLHLLLLMYIFTKLYFHFWTHLLPVCICFLCCMIFMFILSTPENQSFVPFILDLIVEKCWFCFCYGRFLLKLCFVFFVCSFKSSSLFKKNLWTYIY